MLNEKIIYYRKKNMLTQEELAYQLNVSRQTITKWEAGIIYPNVEYSRGGKERRDPALFPGRRL